MAPEPIIVLSFPNLFFVQSCRLLYERGSTKFWASHSSCTVRIFYAGIFPNELVLGTGWPVGYRLPAARPVCPVYRTPGKMKGALLEYRLPGIFFLRSSLSVRTRVCRLSFCCSVSVSVCLSRRTLDRDRDILVRMYQHTTEHTECPGDYRAT